MSEEKLTLYNKTVMDHFINPRNLGEVENPDGVGEVGAAACGDIVKLTIKVEDGKITDARFKTFGCGSAIAASSIATELIKGKTIEEASRITNSTVMDNLGGEDYWKANMPQKIHCSVLCEEAIAAVLEDYLKKHPDKIKT